MIIVHTNRQGVYIKNGPRTIFIKNGSPRRPFRTFQHLMESTYEHGNGIICIPSTNNFECFAALYTNVQRGGVMSGDFARREALSARILSRRSVLA